MIHKTVRVMFLLVISIDISAASLMAQNIGTPLTIHGVGPDKKSDPSIANTGPHEQAWMSYSAVHPSPRWPDKNTRTITTRLAYSDDQGATWTDLGYPVNNITEIAIGSKAGTWNSEVSSLVFDPYGSPDERWKLFWHHYLHVNEKGEFQNGWIAYKTASSPRGLAEGKETKLFGARAYNAANNIAFSETGSPVGGAPVVQTQSLNPALSMCVALSEPGAMATPSGLFLSLNCFKPKLFGVTTEIVLLRCAAPCHPGNARAWRYIATVLTEDDAKTAGFEAYSAPDLFSENRRYYLIASPVSNRPFRGSRNGCRVFRFANLETGELDRTNGKPRVIQEIDGEPGTNNGACSYAPAVVASGFVYSQLTLTGGKPYFEIFQTGRMLQTP